MGLKKKAARSAPNKPNPFELGGFCLLVANRFEAAFTLGRMINLINNMEAYQGTIGNQLNRHYISEFIGNLDDCCRRLGLPSDQETQLLQFVAELTNSLIPRHGDGAETTHSQFDNWLAGPQDTTYPNPWQTRLKLQDFNDPLVKIRNMLRASLELANWVEFGISLDGVFRGLDLDNRIHKAWPTSAEAKPNAKKPVKKGGEKELSLNSNWSTSSRHHKEVKFYPGWQLLDFPFRNRSINSQFSRFIRLDNLIPEKSEKADEECEVMIANAVHEYFRLLDEQSKEKERDGFEDLWIVKVKEFVVKRNELQNDLKPHEFKLLRCLLLKRQGVKVGIDTKLNEQMVEKSLFLIAAGEVCDNKQINDLVCKINFKLLPLGLRIVNLKKSYQGTKTTGRCIVDMQNALEVAEAKAFASHKSPWPTTEEINDSIEKLKAKVVSK